VALDPDVGPSVTLLTALPLWACYGIVGSLFAVGGVVGQPLESLFPLEVADVFQANNPRVLDACGPMGFEALARQHQLPIVSSCEDSPGADGLMSCKAHSPLA
jgi:hypothetical protein